MTGGRGSSSGLEGEVGLLLQDSCSKLLSASSDEDFAAALRAVLLSTAQWAGMSSACLHTVSPELTMELVQSAGSGITACPPISSWTWLLAQVGKLRIIRIEVPGQLPDNATVERSFLLEHKIRSLFALPLTLRRSVYGVLTLLHTGAASSLPGEDLPLHLLGMLIMAILERRRMEHAMSESQRQLNVLVGNLDAGLFSANRYGLFTQCNPYIERITGYPSRELVGRHVSRIAHPADAERVSQIVTSILDGLALAAEFRIVRKDGIVGHVMCSGCPMYRQGRIVGAQGILTDISRRKIAEERMEYGKETLAMRVAEKTAQLTKVVRRLSCEIAERRQNEQQVVQCRDQLRLLTVELLKAEDEERQKIASDLHDRIGQNLALARMSLDQALAASVSDPQKEVLSQACDYLSDAIRDTRSLTCELSPPMLHELGIAAALESLLKQFRENHKMEFVLVCEGKTGELNRAINSALYRMTRELLVNAVKHSMAKRVEVNISAAPSSITLVVSDDGVGFDASAGPISSDNKGFGLFSIQERIGHLGGELRVEAEKGRGSRMTLFLPLVELRSVDNAQ